MLGKLAGSRDVGYLDTIGHDPDFPITDCWPHLVDESIRFIEARYRGPVVGVGHSLGGFLMFYAALKRPDLFRAIIILDSPLMGPSRSFGIWLAKRLGFIQRVTPGGNTLARRDNWATVEMAHDYFARKPKFARFDPDCLADYALHGTQDDGKGGRRLKFRPQVEHDIYASRAAEGAGGLAGRLGVGCAARQRPGFHAQAFRGHGGQAAGQPPVSAGKTAGNGGAHRAIAGQAGGGRLELRASGAPGRLGIWPASGAWRLRAAAISRKL
ncbi:alpha/beta fold hydrolase [Chromobacterium piscinae]|uniref:alpha/beta fold hydrolase n=1 Tax=Chromobacterium piscinae TaxID=686831 RepID=UPI0032608058